MYEQPQAYKAVLDLAFRADCSIRVESRNALSSKPVSNEQVLARNFHVLATIKWQSFEK
jgi:hypothetical protein